MDQHLPPGAAEPRASLSRRQFLAGSVASGLAVTGLAGQAVAAVGKSQVVGKPARHVIFVLMSGGPSQMETFDPKTGAPTGGPFGSTPTRPWPGGRTCPCYPACLRRRKPPW
jgi:hypothetical protein